MRYSWLWILAVMGCTPVAEQTGTGQAETVVVAAATEPQGGAKVPADVAEYLEARDTCTHFLGEFAGDPAVDGPRGINQQIEAACTGLDERLAALQARYQDNAAVTAMLVEEALLE
ncbi:MAG: hypothetical protein KA214_06640 [Neisseriaceae bacterium]|nr:hypothetical protein [Neisseriaceae bacterium]